MKTQRILLLGQAEANRDIPEEAQLRNLYMARALAARGHDVHVALAISPHIASLPLFSDLTITAMPRAGSTITEQNYDVAIAPLELYPHDVQVDIPLAINLQAPVFTATLPEQSSMTDMDAYYFSKKLAMTWRTMRRGDFFICATQQQRLFYLGMLNMAGRSNNLTVNDLAHRMQVVTPGVPMDTPAQGDNPYTALGVNDGEPVVLWPSGLYDWYEPLCVAEAFPRVLEKLPRSHLVFAGASNPSAERLCTTHLAALRDFIETHRLERHVHITDWLPYEDRARLYQHATLGVCTYTPSFETELSWRSRIIDMLWGGLPVLATGGDSLSDMIAQYGAGAVLPSHNPEDIATALTDYLHNSKWLAQARQGVTELAGESLDWNKTIEPLAAYCAVPTCAPDGSAEALGNAMHAHFGITIRSGLKERLHMKLHASSHGTPPSTP